VVVAVVTARLQRGS